jgi:hypothetical protein
MPILANYHISAGVESMVALKLGGKEGCFFFTELNLAILFSQAFQFKFVQ